MMKRNVTALVTDGAMRDKAGVLASRLPVWCAGVASPASVNGLTFVGWQQPIGCGGCAIFPDDVIVVDDDGAVVIPQNLRRFRRTRGRGARALRRLGGERSGDRAPSCRAFIRRTKTPRRATRHGASSATDARVSASCISSSPRHLPSYCRRRMCWFWRSRSGPRCCSPNASAPGRALVAAANMLGSSFLAFLRWASSCSMRWRAGFPLGTQAARYQPASSFSAASLDPDVSQAHGQVGLDGTRPSA